METELLSILEAEMSVYHCSIAKSLKFNVFQINAELPALEEIQNTDRLSKFRSNMIVFVYSNITDSGHNS